MRLAGQRCWRATRTPDGPATLAIELQGSEVLAEAWGPGAERALAGIPDLVGLNDDRSGFRPQHRVIAELERRYRGIRITRSRAVLESLVPGILEQKVTGEEARRSFRGLVRAFGEPAPGPEAFRCRPRPSALRRSPTTPITRSASNGGEPR
jgi:3-methyladenine DNA glycosylase/8-oxoguanine DNA glycosylase